jgi:hypothetical protein
MPMCFWDFSPIFPLEYQINVERDIIGVHMIIFVFFQLKFTFTFFCFLWHFLRGEGTNIHLKIFIATTSAPFYSHIFIVDKDANVLLSSFFNVCTRIPKKRRKAHFLVCIWLFWYSSISLLYKHPVIFHCTKSLDAVSSHDICLVLNLFLELGV